LETTIKASFGAFVVILSGESKKNTIKEPVGTTIQSQMNMKTLPSLPKGKK